jgi:competence/damage-inducible protein CinA-like protein
MPSAEIITIGTEILLGEIVDTNSSYIARALRDVGIDLYRTSTVGDNASRIAQAIQQALNRSNIVITTGGLGPTVDDPTREAVAQAMGVEVEYHPELWEQILRRFERYGRIPTENNKRQAYIPAGAIAVENPVGTAPAFIYETEGHTIISLPGVPSEMETLVDKTVIPYLRQHYNLHGVIKARVLHTAGVGESQIDELIGDLERLSNPTVGLAAHSGQVDVRITAKADSVADADGMIRTLEQDLRQRLGNWIYGADEETLVSAVFQALRKYGWSLGVVEAGLGGGLIKRLASETGPFIGGEVLTRLPDIVDLSQITDTYRLEHGAQVGVGVALHPSEERQNIDILLITPQDRQQFSRPYGGHPANASRWAVNQCLNIIRNL